MIIKYTLGQLLNSHYSFPQKQNSKYTLQNADELENAPASQLTDSSTKCLTNVLKC